MKHVISVKHVINFEFHDTHNKLVCLNICEITTLDKDFLQTVRSV